MLGFGVGGLLGLAGHWYERVSQRRYRARFTPPGCIYDIDGRRMHMLCMGERRPGQPLVILEAGHGSWSSCWQKVQPEVARFARVCAYDRAGYGWSDPVPGPAKPERMVADLHALLRHAGEPGPYLMVGHSMGGALVRLFATLFPEEVTGMVWVDSVQEDFPAYLPVGRWAFSAVQRGAYLGALLAEMGFLRATGLGRFIAQYPSVTDPLDGEALTEQVSQPGYMRVVAAETATLADLPGWQRVQPHYADLPVISLEALYSEQPPFHITPPLWQRFRAGWHRMHDDLSLRAEHIERIPVACGHVIMNERPDLVVEAIRKQLERLQAG